MAWYRFMDLDVLDGGRSKALESEEEEWCSSGVDL